MTVVPTRRRRPGRRLLPGAVLTVPVLALVLAGCGAGDADSSSTGAPTGSGGSPSDVTGTVDVFAAASLTGAFEQIAEDFQERHPDAEVVFNFGGSSALAQQIVSGAPADVFAAASPATMQTVTDAGDATDPQVFARNRLQIAVPPDNPGEVTGLSDLGRSGLTIALCAPEVPCGAAATRVLEAAGVEAAPDTLEQDVKAALSKVELGEVDAALVYRTDVLAAGDRVQGIAFPEADGAVNDYPVVTLEGATEARAAEAFVEHVLSPEGQRVLADAGFDSP